MNILKFNIYINESIDEEYSDAIKELSPREYTDYINDNFSKKEEFNSREIKEIHSTNDNGWPEPHIKKNTYHATFYVTYNNGFTNYSDEYTFYKYSDEWYLISTGFTTPKNKPHKTYLCDQFDTLIHILKNRKQYF